MSSRENSRSINNILKDHQKGNTPKRASEDQKIMKAYQESTATVLLASGEPATKRGARANARNFKRLEADLSHRRQSRKRSALPVIEEDEENQPEELEVSSFQFNSRDAKRTCLAASPVPVVASAIMEASSTSAEPVNLAATNLIEIDDPASTSGNSVELLEQLTAPNLIDFPNIYQNINQEAAPNAAPGTMEIAENSDDINDQMQVSFVPQFDYKQVIRDLRRPGLLAMPKNVRHTKDTVLLAYPHKVEVNNDTKYDEDKFYTFKPRQESSNLLPVVDLRVKNVKTLAEGNYLDDMVVLFMMNTFVEEYIFKISDKAERLKQIQKMHIYDTSFLGFLINYKQAYREKGENKVAKLSLLSDTRDVSNADKARIRGILQNEKRRVRFNLFNKDLVILPVFDESHWFLVVFVNLSGCYKNKEEETKKKCTILLLDPMGTSNLQRMKNFKTVMMTFLETWYNKTKQIKGQAFGITGDFAPEQVQFGTIKNLPMQNNLYDCGAFVVHYLEGIFGWKGGFSNIEDHFNIDWSTWHPDANKSADITRHKMMGTIMNAEINHPQNRLSRLDFSVWERILGFKAAGFPKRRSQSAQGRPKSRHAEFSDKRYTFDGGDFLSMRRSPREFYDNPATRMAREKRCPEHGKLYVCH